ncbi:hypothetical protein [Paenibacillus agricola]|uniref:Uncharacterized protein n=1 Tax=Paenibacillus agricola TaxID=2716264 RepID=A0ABX0JLF3_9BACL|nr:hypothetical protein [Paenibacillus agricola]NHN35544.1 hypothetical protein [Paenibacillus agricola]
MSEIPKEAARLAMDGDIFVIVFIGFVLIIGLFFTLLLPKSGGKHVD